MQFDISHAASSRVVKGEDFVAVKQLSKQGWLYLIADGHAGQGCARFVSSELPRHLEARLPPLPATYEEQGGRAYADLVSSCLCEAFVAMDDAWCTDDEACDASGAALTVVMITGRLVTAAAVGDSAALLDTGFSVLDLTESHRIHDNEKEMQRLKAAGCQLAPCGIYGTIAGPGDPGIGPKRVWPGGLACSRSIGDLDAAVHVIPIPHVKQVCLPERGCRLILASDGLWDCLHKGDVIKLARKQGDPKEAAQTLLRRGAIQPIINDDTTILIIDAMPSSLPSTIASGAGGSLHSCSSIPPSPFLSRPPPGSSELRPMSQASSSGQSTLSLSLPTLPHSSSSSPPLGSGGKEATSNSLHAATMSTKNGITGSQSFVNLVAEAQQLMGGSGRAKSGSPSILATLLFGSCMDPSVIASRNLPPDARDEPSGSPGYLRPVLDADGLQCHPSLLNKYIESTSRPGGFRSRAGSRESTVHSEVSALTALLAGTSHLHQAQGARISELGGGASSAEVGIHAQAAPGPVGEGGLGGWRKTSGYQSVPHIC